MQGYKLFTHLYSNTVTNLSSSNKKFTGYRDIFVFTTFS